MSSVSHNSVSAAPVVRFARRGRRLSLDKPLRVLTASRISDVAQLIAEVEREAAAGRFAAGFVSYEAAPAFDAALSTHSPGLAPLAWFAVYESAPIEGASPNNQDAVFPELAWGADVSESGYRADVRTIRELIAAGDTYQVNYTFPLRTRSDGDPARLFDALADAQPTDFGCFIDAGDFALLSVSPELFFRLDGARITCRPMKGTASRGLSSADDEARAAALSASPKERAENVMIVDMVRNDLGRIAAAGTVDVKSLYDVERLDTCWQMTSTVEAETDAPLVDIFRALFPSASVTGAPKVRTMQIIRELEASPRGVYCGAIGWVGPGRRAEFSVGIRTLTIDKTSRQAVYNVGSGITWDSAAMAEFDECRLKAAVLTHRRVPFELLESILWDGGYWLLDAHLNRMRASANYFGFAWSDEKVRAALDEFARTQSGKAKVRLRLCRGGAIEMDVAPIGDTALWRVAVSPEPVDEGDVFLYHKSTHRAVYERAQALCPDSDDVILWNCRGELTESTRANLALRFGGQWYTPPVASGLLGGVFRAELLREGAIAERVLTLSDLDSADEVRLINSVRGWIDVELAPRSALFAGRAK